MKRFKVERSVFTKDTITKLRSLVYAYNHFDKQDKKLAMIYALKIAAIVIENLRADDSDDDE